MTAIDRDRFGTFPLSTIGVPEIDRVAVWRGGDPDLL